MENSDHCRHNVNDIVTLHVIEVESNGLICKIVGSNSKCFVNRHELSWSRRITDAREFYSLGDQFDAKIIDIDPSGRIKSSRKKVLTEPFFIYKSILKRGDIVIGEVTNIYRHGVNIDINSYSSDGKVFTNIFEEGLQGHISINNILDRDFKNIDEVLLLNDVIKCEIIRIDYENNSFEASIRKYLLVSEYSHRSITGINIDLNLFSNHNLTKMQERESLNVKALKKIKRVLLIDDNGQYCEALSEYLYQVINKTEPNNDFKIKVISYSDMNDVHYSISSEAIKEVRVNRYDLILIDLNLGKEDGLLLAKSIKTFMKNALIIILNGNTINSYQAEMIKTLKLDQNIFSKANPPHKLINLINYLVDIEKRVIKSSGYKNLDLINEDFDNLSNAVAKIEINQYESFDQLFKEVEFLTGCHALFLLSMDLITKNVNLVGSRGVLESKFKKDMTQIGYSPIYGVLKGKDFYFDNNIQLNLDRYIHVCKLFTDKISAFCGFPIIYEDYNCYGLFLIKFEEFNESHFDYELIKNKAEVMSLKIGIFIERENLKKLMNEYNRYLITGRNFAQLEHDLNGLLNPARVMIDNILIALQSKTLDQNELIDKVKNISKNLYEIENLRQFYLNTLRNEQNKIIDIFEHLNAFIKLFEKLCEKNEIKIIITKQNDVPAFRVNVAAIDQIMTNIILNSIDFVPTIRKTNGQIEIILSFSKNDPFPVKIRVRDNGPGIHKAHFKRVFNALFTTRIDGCGLGLSIVKDLVGHLEGNIFVESSILFYETTFCLELPFEINRSHS